MQAYVDGALFSEDKKKIVLVKKNKPDWQCGKLNFVGGKIEKPENAYQAMVREFKEETGVLNEDWNFKLSIVGPQWIVYFFMAHGDITKVKTIESEEIVVVDVEKLPVLETVPNVRWITPLMLDPNIVFPIGFHELDGVKP